jgi:UDP-galactopyranose mutase
MQITKKSYQYDFLVVGAGLFGSVFAREMHDMGRKCLIIDKRNHIGGNVFTENIEGINVHKYGAHIFHTDSQKVWNYVNRYAKFNHYRHKVFVNYKGTIYSFPINLMTFNQIWGIKTPDAAKTKLQEMRLEISSPRNLEEWVQSQIGNDLYERFIRGYTTKQWQRNPKDLPSSIVQRIPIRTSFNDFYFDDIYQGIPIGGYTKLIQELTDGIKIETGVDYFKNRQLHDALARYIIFTGRIDEFFNFEFGELEYRSLKFETHVFNTQDFQGTSVVNYTDAEVPHTRILEHKHFEFGKQPVTVITKEYPDAWTNNKEPYYPVNDDKNSLLYQKYKQLSEKMPHVIFGGRLAEYRYYDMDEVVESALFKANQVKGFKNEI